MAGTRAESLVDQALNKLGVVSEISNVQEIKKDSNSGRITIDRSRDEIGIDSGMEEIDTEEEFDEVLFSVGSQPNLNYGTMGGLSLSSSERLVVDKTLRC